MIQILETEEKTEEVREEEKMKWTDKVEDLTDRKEARKDLTGKRDLTGREEVLEDLTGKRDYPRDMTGRLEKVTDE